MNRSVSPIHLHVNRKAPVHVHVGGTGPAPCAQTASSSLGSTGRRMRASDWVKAGSSKGPWVPPTTKSSGSRMTWQGPTHRLEINPVESGDGTRLRLSDLGKSGTTDIILNAEEEASTSPQISALTAEVNNLKEEIDLHRSLRELEEAQAGLRASRLSLREKEIEREAQDAMMRQELVCSKHCSICREGSQAISFHREALLGQMGQVDVDSSAIIRHSENLRSVLRRLIRDKNLSVSRAREATDHSRLLQERLGDLDSSMHSLKQLVKAQQKLEGKARHLDDQRESLLCRVADSEARNEVLKAQVADRDKLAVHSQELHDQLTQKEDETQALCSRVKTLEESLHRKELECIRTETSLLEMKRKAQTDKDALKKATHLHKERALKNEASATALAQQVEELSATLEIFKRNSIKDKLQADTEIRTLTTQVRDLKKSLEESQYTGHTHQSALNATNVQLSDKNHEISTLQLENEKLKVAVSSLEGQLKTFQCTCQSRLATAQTEVAELQGTVAQYESLLSDYRTQLEQSHGECEELTRELRKKQHELDELQHSSIMEQERMKLRFQQKVADLEGYPDELKTTQSKLQEAQERLEVYERRNSDQVKLLAELTTKVEQKTAVADTIKAQLHGSVTECKTNAVRLEGAERRLQELDQQNRELMALTSKKEETIQRLQGRMEEFIREKTSLGSQLDSLRADLHHQTGELHEKAAARERADHSRIAELQTQLSRSTATASQLRRSKEETERKLHTRIHDLQERLEQSQATKKSLENYVTFLKSSYASIFSESPGAHHSPLL